MYTKISSAVVRVLQQSRFLPVCFIAFVASRLALLLLVPAAEPFSDAGWYLSRAITLAEQGLYSEGGIPTAYWPVGYPAFLALLFKVTGPSLLAARLANLALAASSFWLLYLVTSKFLNDDVVARGTVLLLTLYPNNAAYVPLLLTETLYIFLLLVASVLLLSKRTWLHILLAGCAFGLATLVKTQTLLLMPVLAFIAFLGDWSIKSALRALIPVAAVVTIALAVVAPWTIRNYTVFGKFVLVSTNGGMTLLGGNNPSMVGDYGKNYSQDDPLIAQARFSVEDQVEADRRARDLARQWIKDHPGQFLGLIPQKLFRLWAPDGEGEWGYQDTPFYESHSRWFRATRLANQAFYAIALVLFLAALWRLLRLRASPVEYFGVGVVLVVSLVSGIFSGQSRYHFPAMPFVLAYAAWVVIGRQRKADIVES